MPETSHHSEGSLGKVTGRPGRSLHQVGVGHRGLHPSSWSFLSTKKADVFRDTLLWDMFASPGNHKFPLICARYPHWKAKKVDALTCPLDDVQFCYSNPPWNLITQWLSRLRDHPHLTCWVIVPFWASAPWWPLLTRLQVPKSPCYKVLPFPGMFTNCVNRVMPPDGPFAQ